METKKRFIRNGVLWMKRLFVVLLALVFTMSTVVVTALAEETAYTKIGYYSNEVLLLHRKLAELGYYSLRPESPWSAKSADALKILQENMGWEITGTVADKEMYDAILSLENVVGKNYAVGSSGEWSDWFTPEYNAENRCFTVAVAELGSKSIGDYYTCSVEIEVKDVTATEGLAENQKFWLRSQGAVDGQWVGNLWSDNLISLRTAPEDGVYKYTAISRITDKNVDGVRFDLGFRCDYWKSGSFRVRNVKVEKGNKATEWCAAE